MAGEGRNQAVLFGILFPLVGKRTVLRLPRVLANTGWQAGFGPDAHGKFLIRNALSQLMLELQMVWGRLTHPGRALIGLAVPLYHPTSSKGPAGISFSVRHPPQLS